MTLRTRLISQLVFPLQERFKGHDTVRVRKQLEESQWFSPEKLEALRLARLRALLDYAGQHVPYYRDLFRSCDVDARSITSTTSLSGLPFLTKDIIRERAEALISERAGHLVKLSTGGSTGQPLTFHIGAERVSHDVAAKWRATRWWGVDIGDPEVVVWGSPIELGAQDRIRAWRDRIMRTQLLPAFAMSSDKLDSFVSEIRRVRPRMLFGYPSAIALIARHARQRGVRMSDLGIKVAFVTAEKLYEDQRSDIASVFGCRVANGYGGRDAGFIAHECPHGQMHLTAEDVVVEIVDQRGTPLPPGEAGEIVVTHLATRDFPFIRYRTGDVGVLTEQPCTCGRVLPVLAEIQGRATDFVLAQDGTVLHGLALIYVLRELVGIKAFKIIQESRDLVRVLVVPTSAFNASVEDQIRAGFAARLGAKVEVLIERVGEVPSESSGKFRYVVSKAVP